MSKTPKRPRDANQLAKLVIDIATEIVADVPMVISETAQRAGAKGGTSRATNLTTERKREIATTAARARWGKQAR